MSGEAISLEGDSLGRLKSLTLRGFWQIVRMAQNWQHFTNELILKIHEVGSSFYSQGELEMAKVNGGNVKPKGLKVGA